MSKSREAFRTISEVSDWLDTPAHVLRFWESRFTQIKPMKRAGGRRYYRPNDMRLIGGIKKLLHEDGMTIRGVQKILREQGIKHVTSLSPTLNDTVSPKASDKGEDRTASRGNQASPPELAPQPSPMPAPSPDEVTQPVASIVSFTRDTPEPQAAPESLAEQQEPEPAQALEEQRIDLRPEEEKTLPPGSIPTPAPGAMEPVSQPPMRPMPETQSPSALVQTTETPMPMPTRLRDLADIGGVPDRHAQTGLRQVYGRLKALRDRVAGEL